MVHPAGGKYKVCAPVRSFSKEAIRGVLRSCAELRPPAPHDYPRSPLLTRSYVC